MKKFIFNLMVFSIILLLVNLFFYVIAYKVYYQDYEQVDLSFDTYLLADSHGTSLEKMTEKYGIYNFSGASDSYFDMFIKVKYLIKNTNVKTIIITADDHTLSPYRETSNNLERSSYFILAEDYPFKFSGMLNSLKKSLVILNPGIRGIIRSYIQSLFIKSIEVKEWSKISNVNKDLLSKDRFNYQFKFKSSSVTLTHSLVDIIKLCKDNNIELIGIQFPLTKSYLNTIDQKSYDAEKVLFNHQLKVLDFRKSFLTQDSYFMNQDHLNEIGGREFLKELSIRL